MHIHVAFDGGRGGIAALEWVASWADPRDQVTVVSVEELTLFGAPVAPASGHTASESLDEATQWMHFNAPQLAVDFVRDTGDAAESLLRRSIESDLLVIGSHHGGTDHGRLEPVPRKVAALSIHPVVVVPASNALPDGPVVVGVAEDELSTSPVVFAAEAAQRVSRPLRVVHAWWVVPHSEWDDKESGGTAALEHHAVVDAAIALAHEHAPAVAISGEPIVGESLSVLSTAAAVSSLTVVGRRRSGVLAEWLLGTVAHDLLAELPAPIAIIPTVR